MKFSAFQSINQIGVKICNAEECLVRHTGHAVEQPIHAFVTRSSVTHVFNFSDKSLYCYCMARFSSSVDFTFLLTLIVLNALTGSDPDVNTRRFCFALNQLRFDQLLHNHF